MYGFPHQLGMESIKFPSILDPPDNPASARGNIRTQKPKQTKSRNGKLQYCPWVQLHLSISEERKNTDGHFMLPTILTQVSTCIGCITCKAKRLKCDEIKPSCHQCERRKVQCGGYKKDFKWRPFEETNLASGRPTVTKAKKGKRSRVPCGSDLIYSQILFSKQPVRKSSVCRRYWPDLSDSSDD